MGHRQPAAEKAVGQNDIPPGDLSDGDVAGVAPGCLKDDKAGALLNADMLHYRRQRNTPPPRVEQGPSGYTVNIAGKVDLLHFHQVLKTQTQGSLDLSPDLKAPIPEFLISRYPPHVLQCLHRILTRRYAGTAVRPSLSRQSAVLPIEQLNEHTRQADVNDCSSGCCDKLSSRNLFLLHHIAPRDVKLRYKKSSILYKLITISSGKLFFAE